MGHSYRIELRDSVSGWYVWIRQVTMEVQQQSIQFNSMNASIDASGNVNVQSSISASKTLASSLTYEYVVDCGGNTYGTKSFSVSNSSSISANHSFKLNGGFPSGVYQIALHVKDPSTGKVLASSTTTATSPCCTSWVSSLTILPST